MSKVQPTSSLSRIAKKFFLSAFVVVTFGAYAIHERSDSADTPGTRTAQLAPAFSSSQNNQPSAAPRGGFGGDDDFGAMNPQPSTLPQPTAAPARTGAYRDGQYTGNLADAFYGTVQVEATIQNGQITDVQFLDYPHDRRTSQRINEQVMPWLKTEAIQAQNANVDLISGATLTSQAFVQSLQTALQQARG